MLPNIQHRHVLEISKTETEARSNEGPHEDGYKSLNPKPYTATSAFFAGQALEPEWALCSSQRCARRPLMWVVVKIRVPFWVP